MQSDHGHGVVRTNRVTDKAFVHFRGFRTSDSKPRRRRLGRRRGRTATGLVV